MIWVKYWKEIILVLMIMILSVVLILYQKTCAQNKEYLEKYKHMFYEANDKAIKYEAMLVNFSEKEKIREEMARKSLESVKKQTEEQIKIVNQIRNSTGRTCEDALNLIKQHAKN